MLAEIKEQKLLVARGIVGLFPAVSDRDDIIVLNEDANKEIGKLHGIRQQVYEDTYNCLCTFCV